MSHASGRRTTALIAIRLRVKAGSLGSEVSTPAKPGKMTAKKPTVRLLARSKTMRG